MVELPKYVAQLAFQKLFALLGQQGVRPQAARLAAAADASGPISSETRREKNSVSVMQTAAVSPISAPTASVCRRLWRMTPVLPSMPLW